MLVAVHDQHFRQQSARLEEAQALMARYHIGHQNLASLLGAAGRLGQ
jgi:hypothetical protein